MPPLLLPFGGSASHHLTPSQPVPIADQLQPHLEKALRETPGRSSSRRAGRFSVRPD